MSDLLVQDAGGFVVPAARQPCPRSGGAEAADFGERLRVWDRGAPGGSAAPAAGLWEEGGSRPGRKGLCCRCLEAFGVAASLAAARMQPQRGRAAAGPPAFGCRKDEPSRQVRPVPLPPVQQNLNYYPQIFWLDGCAEAGAPCPPAAPAAPFPPPVPERSRKPRNKDRERSSAGFLVMFLLILVAFTGVGLSIFKIFHLEKEVDELRESASAEHIPPASQKLTGQRKEVRRAAHVTGNPAQQDLPLEWEPTSGHAYTSGIQYHKRGLLVSEPGLYFVYSKVLFRGSACDSQLLSHVVYKRNPASPGSLVLMEDKATNFCMGQRMWARSSYLGALFRLRKMDSLHVNVSKIALVNFEESKTFFGLFKL
ncbi:tumor necrosis factor ligand superfamily member 6 [Onychostruthus taczanowskii]|uniref:tumor necrosis factor ligand superfamily member 6 n=1 Tax=Onychostruthus taczanowskii TaxID=356909 RepID=UPI001B801559|nr:tumor necrosis factor ligand superfamily member 6 [Onychostruthus taczanowskii]